MPSGLLRAESEGTVDESRMRSTGTPGVGLGVSDELARGRVTTSDVYHRSRKGPARTAARDSDDDNIDPRQVKRVSSLAGASFAAAVKHGNSDGSDPDEASSGGIGLPRFGTWRTQSQGSSPSRSSHPSLSSAPISNQRGTTNQRALAAVASAAKFDRASRGRVE